eukprot:jgi/Mesvir1/4029/Mv26278-RA.1
MPYTRRQGTKRNHRENKLLAGARTRMSTSSASKVEPNDDVRCAQRGDGRSQVERGALQHTFDNNLPDRAIGVGDHPSGADARPSGVGAVHQSQPAHQCRVDEGHGSACVDQKLDIHDGWLAVSEYIITFSYIKYPITANGTLYKTTSARRLIVISHYRQRRLCMGSVYDSKHPLYC